MKKILLFFCACCISYTVFAQLHLCPGTCADFVDNFSTNATSWQWTFVGANPSTSTDQNPINICYNAPGSYDVILITTDTAGSDTFLLNNYVTVYPYPLPMGIIQSHDTLFATQGFLGYQWYLDGNLVPGATDNFYVMLVSGDVNVVGIDANGCEVEAAFWWTIGMAENDLENLATVFPNPANEKIIIKNEGFEIETATINIYNMLGVLSAQPHPDSYLDLNIKHQTSVDVSALAKGMYWLEINSSDLPAGQAGKTYRSKFIKQ